MMRLRKGFTIVELLMVIAVLAVLTVIVTTAASAAIRKGRSSRATAMAAAVQSGIATYNAQHDKWPGVIEDWAEKGEVTSSGVNSDGSRNSAAIGQLNSQQYDDIMQELLKERRDGRPVMDFGALVAGPKGVPDGRQNGIDYRLWVQRMKDPKKSGKNKIPAGMNGESSLTFGYAGTENGKFYRFKITYNAGTDSVTVEP